MKIINLSQSPDYALQYETEIGDSFAKLVKRFTHYTIEGLIDEISTGRKTVWIILTDDDKFLAAVLTHDVKLMNGAVVLEIMELAGKGGAKLFETIPILEKWAKENNYHAIRTYGRYGWHKVFSKFKYKLLFSVYEKEL